MTLYITQIKNWASDDHKGLAFDILKAAFKKNHIKHTVFPLKRTMQTFKKDGNNCILGGNKNLYPLPLRDKLIHSKMFSNSQYYFWSSPKKEPLKSKDQLEHSNIIYFRGTRVHKLFKEKGYKYRTLKAVNSIEQGINMVLKGRADYFFFWRLDNTELKYQLRRNKNFSFAFNTSRIVCFKNEKTIKVIEEFNHFLKNERSKLKAIFQSHKLKLDL